MKYYFVNETKSIQAKILTKTLNMDTIYLSQLYLPHYFIQEDNVSPNLSDMDTSKPIELQIYSSDAHEVLASGILTSKDIEYIQNLINHFKV